MATAAAAAAERSKRKRDPTHEKPTKRRRSASSESEDPDAKIIVMEQGILESKKNYNDITVLLNLVDDFSQGSPNAMLAAVALCRIFVRLLAQGALTPKKGISEKESILVGWLRERLEDYKAKLSSLLGEEEVAPTVLTLSMRTLKAEGEFLNGNKEDYSFPKAFLQDILAVLIVSDDEDVKKAFIEDYAEQFDDIRYYTFNALK